MRKRPLCMVCLILLAIQLVRVSFLQNTKDQKPSLVETLISDEKDVICEGTVYKIENKSQSTAIYLKDAVVSCTDQKSKNQNENRTEAECVGDKTVVSSAKESG